MIPLMKLNYWKTNDKKEVDFLISKGKKVKSAIQVCYSMNDCKTKNREITALTTCLEQFELKKGTIITKDYEKEIRINGKTINIIPAWKWLLS